MTEEKGREIKGETAAKLRQGGMDPRRADEVATRIVGHVAAKVAGEPVPERFRPIADSRKRR